MFHLRQGDRRTITRGSHADHPLQADGNHEVRTAWGFLAVRTNGLERYPGESDQWWADRVTILMALGVLDPEGNPTARWTRQGVAGAQYPCPGQLQARSHKGE